MLIQNGQKDKLEPKRVCKTVFDNFSNNEDLVERQAEVVVANKPIPTSSSSSSKEEASMVKKTLHIEEKG